MRFAAAEGGLLRDFADIAEHSRKKYFQIRDAQDAFSNVKMGADGAPSTRMDLELEACVFQKLRTLRINARVLSEEAGWIAFGDANSSLIIIVDPLDGTTNASMGYPYFGFSIAGIRESVVTDALVMNYCSGDVYIARKGEGAYLNGRRISVSSQSDLSQCRLMLSRPLTCAESAFYASLLLGSKRVRIGSCPSLDTAFIATGGAEAYVDFHVAGGLIHTHDVIAAKLILEEAGGYLLDEGGHPSHFAFAADATYNIFAVNSIPTFASIIEISRKRS